MSDREPTTSAGFIRAYVVPALLLFAIPLAGYAFVGYADRSWDQQFLDAATTSVEQDAEVTPARRQAILAFYRTNPPSALCAGEGPGRDALPPAFAASACGDYRQFRWIAQASIASIALGLFSLVLVLGCAGLSFASRELQYLSFVAGWNILRVTSAVQVVAQGFIATMLSFWLTVVFTEHYSLKLVAVVGIAALAAAGTVIVAIFRKPADDFEVEGQLLTRTASPALWARVDALCGRLGTRACDHIVGGIDDNFFVTEHPVHLTGRVLRGRTLYLSLSLLKRLDKSEADAILAHEMAHFSGGDTQYSKKLAPRLARFRHYLIALHNGGLSRPIYYFMLFYWSLFQLALNSSSRQRELRADKAAADLTSPASVANALCKVAAYSSYRTRVEAGLFQRDRGHDVLDIASTVAAGFLDYARGPHLVSDLSARSFPHPFDSHPPLGMRIAAVGVEARSERVADAVTAAPAQTWFAEIGDAERIESTLWKAYEARFQEAHEASLAYRYLPVTAEERGHVERFFPAIQLAGKRGKPGLAIDCTQLHYEGWPDAIAWAGVTDIKAADQTFRGKVVTLQVVTASGSTEKRTIPLAKLADGDDAVLQAVSRYYDRYLNAKAYQAQVA